MGITKNWLSNSDKSEIKDFVEQNMFVTVEHIEQVLDEDCGQSFLCLTQDNMNEYTGEDNYSLEFGSFGLVKHNSITSKVENNFVLAKLKPYLFKEYVLMIARKNIVDGEPVKINGKTYREAFVSEFQKYVESLNIKTIYDLITNNERCDYINLSKLLKEINSDLLELEAACDTEPSNE